MCIYTYAYTYTYIYTYIHTYKHTYVYIQYTYISLHVCKYQGWKTTHQCFLNSQVSFATEPYKNRALFQEVSFAKEPYKNRALFQERHNSTGRLRIVATPYTHTHTHTHTHAHTQTHMHTHKHTCN